MALRLISTESTPTYLALSSDISGSKIAGATQVGKTVFLTDTGGWVIITAGDGTVADYKLPPNS